MAQHCRVGRRSAFPAMWIWFLAAGHGQMDRACCGTGLTEQAWLTPRGGTLWTHTTVSRVFTLIRPEAVQAA